MYLYTYIQKSSIIFMSVHRDISILQCDEIKYSFIVSKICLTLKLKIGSEINFSYINNDSIG